MNPEDQGPAPLHPIEREETDALKVFGDQMLLPDQRKRMRKDAAVELMAAGHDLQDVAAAVGVDRSTLFRWRRDDPEFDQRLRTAMAVTLDKLKVEAERRALRGSDKLLMFLLERYDPEKFHLAQKLEHSGHLNLARMTDAELDDEIASLVSQVGTAPKTDEPGSDLC